MYAQPVLRKITISLPRELVEFTDRQARQNKSSRSHIIRLALVEAKRREEERLAAEGYAFYAASATEFAAASANAYAEVIADVSETW